MFLFTQGPQNLKHNLLAMRCTALVVIDLVMIVQVVEMTTLVGFERKIDAFMSVQS